MPIKNRKVVAVVFNRVAFFELGIAAEVFGLPRPGMVPWYEFSVCSGDEGPLESLGGMQLSVSRQGLRSLATAGTIVIPGWRDVHERPPENVLKAIRKAHGKGTRIISFCTGAFVLAAAGLLDDRPATTHWRYAEILSSMYPNVRVNPNVLYVDDGDVMTAAGSAAGIDVCLHLVRRDFGAKVSNVVARRLVVPPHRDGGQAQFIDRPVTKCEDEGLAKLLDWLTANLPREHTVKSMASKSRMSPRTFARRFRQQTGTTPARWLARERVKLAQNLLETTNLGVEQLAQRCGFGSAQLLRFHFHRVTDQVPTAYRSAFRQTSK